MSIANVPLTLWHAAATLLFILILRTAVLRRWKGPLPPGPPGWPIIGNTFDMPTEYSWKTFAKWGERWGGLISVTILGKPTIIINSYKHAYELLEKRSAIYSDRPRLMMAGEIVGWDQTLVLLRYGHQFRECRRLMARILGSRKSVEQFAPVIEGQVAKLLVRLFRNPGSDLPTQIRKVTAAIVLMISYGYEPEEHDDPLIKLAAVTDELAEVARPGAFLVDVFPFLNYIPSWMPGAGWKRIGLDYREKMFRMSGIPLQFVKNQMAAGTAIPSFTSALLSSNPDADEEYRIRMSAVSIYLGGSDTTVAVDMMFILAMAMFPEMQRRVQAELDAVLGQERLPTYAEVQEMPYLNAAFLEALRFHQASPLGVPHTVTEDDFYEGYHIPNGTTIIVNQWNILHDPDIYANPFSFDPERFLPGPNGKEPEMDPRKAAFGFGRRACPGMYLAEPFVLTVVSMTLTAFEFSNPLTMDGVPITVDTFEHTGSILSHPSPFTCTMKVRSEKARALILAQERS